jgi:hypothetical protein
VSNWNDQNGNGGHRENDRGQDPSGHSGGWSAPGQWAPPSQGSSLGNAPNSSEGGWGGQSPPPPPQGGHTWAPGQGQPPNGRSGGREFALGPLTVADVLDLTFALMKKTWRQLLPAVLAYAVPAGIIEGIQSGYRQSHTYKFNGAFTSSFSYFTSTSHLSNTARAAVLIAGFVGLVIAFGVRPYVQGAITRMVASQYLGRPMKAKEAFVGVKPRYWTFVGASILVAFCTLGGLLFFLVPLFMAVIPIIAIEDESAGNAMGRSWALMSRRYWTYFLIWFVMGIIASISAIVVELIPALIAVGCYAAHLGAVGALFTAVATVLGGLVALPISAIAATLIYFDSRVRNEGFDVQMMAARIPPSSTNPYQVY